MTPLPTATIDHLSEVVKSIEETALNFKFFVTDIFGTYLVYF